MTEPSGSLVMAVETAVATGGRELDELEARVGSILTEFETSADPTSTTAQESGLEVDLRRISSEFAEGLRGHLARQRETLSTFNIAFFGRTGAGKSTLMSAFGELDGGYVSPGESDWTTDVTEISWHGCKLWDTPGINGWGRTQSRDDLEETARRAVEVADMVLLCFDSQSQQASEFARVSEWIRDFGKPAIAVLNVRNLRWRHPAKVSNDSVKRALSQSVREHVDNIHSELAHINLANTPVVAVQSRRALFARAATPFRGPAGANFDADRERFGVEYLTTWSNFSVLEDLISAVIKSGGADLRTTALREGVRGKITAKAAEIGCLVLEIDARIEAAEQSVEELLDVLGYLEGEDRARVLGSGAEDPLTALEAVRGKPFTAQIEGSLDRHVARLLHSGLAQLRADAISRADALLAAAFDDGKDVDDMSFEEAVYRVQEVQVEVDAVWASKSAFLMRKIQLAAFDEVPDLSVMAVESAALGGGAGRIEARVARAMQVGGVAAGAAGGALLVPAVANAWNPAGWGGMAAAVGLGAAAQVGKYAGEWTDANAERKTSGAKSEAMRASRRAVHQTFDRIELDLRARARELSWQIGASAVLSYLRTAVALRAERSALAQLASNFEQTAVEIETSPDPQSVMRDAQARVLGEHLVMEEVAGPIAIGVDSEQGRRVWLGENWFEQLAVAPDVGEEWVDPAFAERSAADRSGLSRALARAWGPAKLQRVAELAEAGERCLRGPEVAHEGVHSAPLPDAFGAADMPLSVVVLGDYSSGKSSLIKRLIAEVGDQIPSSLHVSGGVSTSRVDRYSIGRIQLLDTPGFQGGDPEHSQRALSAVDGAALVLVVVNVNLLIGDTSLLEDIVNGTQLAVAKGNRVIYLVNRADELGIDPVTSPEDFHKLKDRKKEELVAALRTRGVEVLPDQVHVLAGDPFGRVGARTDVIAADYGPHRTWDGVEALVNTLSDFSVELEVAAVAGVRLDAVLRDLLRERMRVDHELSDLRSEKVARHALLQSIENSEQDASLLEASLRERIRSVIEPRANAANVELLALGPKDFHKISLITNWWKTDGAIESEIEQFRSNAHREIEEWFREHSSIISREQEDLDMAVMAVDIDEQFNARTAPEIDGAKVLGDAAEWGAKAVKALGNRDVIYKIGKQVGVRFKPWGAVRAAGRVAKVAPFIAAAGVAADGYAVIKGEREKSERENQRNAAVDFITRTAEGLVDRVLVGSGEDGPLPLLAARARALTEHKEQLKQTRRQSNERMETLAGALSEINQILTNAEILRSMNGAAGE